MILRNPIQEMKTLLMFVPMKVPDILPVPETVEIDEFGFLPMTREQKQHMTQNNRVMRSGYGYQCRNLCRYFLKVNSRQISFKRTGHYYCATCCIAMKCSRCHCCSRVGRAEPRTRGHRLNRADVKFIE
jgi:hypothetical protein